MTGARLTAEMNRTDLLQALRALDARDRDVVRTLYVLRRSPGEAAAALDMPVDEVHHRATRAARQLCARARQLHA
jgi:DNA-directed RNA polymerase specialized sigma24 family protein